MDDLPTGSVPNIIGEKMKIPKYVQKLIDRRCKLADQLALVCYDLDEWLDKNNIECESYDTHTGVEIYINPCSSRRRIINAILKHKEN